MINVDGDTYTLKTALTATPVEVLIGGSEANALANLAPRSTAAAAPGRNYFAGTAALP